MKTTSTSIRKKTKTVAKATKPTAKAAKAAAEQLEIQKLTADFKRLRKEGDYSEIGAMFWGIFATAPLGKFRDAAGDLFDQLDEEEQAMCENC
jgi:hypothetical protein